MAETTELEQITTQGAAALAGVFQNPAMINAIQNKLGTLVGKSSGYIESLPANVKRRVEALKNLQIQNNEIENAFRKEVLELEKKYASIHAPVYEKRYKIVAGEYEPTDQECESVEAEEEPTASPANSAEGPKGISGFWLTALRNIEEVAQSITEDDSLLLIFLVDIKVSYLKDNPGFKLDFVFLPNEWFKNTVLTKTYYLSESSDFGDVIYDHAIGTTINWKEGKDLSVRIEVKKQRHKATNKTRTVKKTVPRETFFSFFSPPSPPDEDEDEDEDDEEMQALNDQLESDYEIGEMIKTRLVPYAIDWFTGKALQYDSDDELDSDTYGDNADSEEEDDEPAPGEKAPECKQQ